MLDPVHPNGTGSVKSRRVKFLRFKRRITEEARVAEMKALVAAIKTRKGLLALSNRQLVTRIKSLARVVFEPLSLVRESVNSPSALNNYWQTLFNRDKPTMFKKFSPSQCPKASPQEVVWEINSPPTASEVKGAIMQMANGKAPGPDMI